MTFKIPPLPLKRNLQTFADFLRDGESINPIAYNQDIGEIILHDGILTPSFRNPEDKIPANSICIGCLKSIFFDYYKNIKERLKETDNEDNKDLWGNRIIYRYKKGITNFQQYMWSYHFIKILGVYEKVEGLDKKEWETTTNKLWKEMVSIINKDIRDIMKDLIIQCVRKGDASILNNKASIGTIGRGLIESYLSYIDKFDIYGHTEWIVLPSLVMQRFADKYEPKEQEVNYQEQKELETA